MERLTERTADGILVKENYEKESLKTLYSCYGEKPNSYYSNCEEGYCAMEKLADYEDAEERGRCDRRQTNADRIRNMSDEELADTLFNSCLEFMHIDECHYADNVGMCKKCISEWLQSEAE